MNAKLKGAVLLAVLAAWNAQAAFDPPTRAELKAAAEDVSKVVELLKDASIDQSAEVAKDVVCKGSGLVLDEDFTEGLFDLRRVFVEAEVVEVRER